jgi:membrane associated rhomboid family serine protease
MTSDLTATLQTSLGPITVRLFPDHAPKTVRNFVELAEGTREWTHPRTGRSGRTRLYDGTLFHRVIPDFMIQGGDPLGTGTGGPGTDPETVVPHRFRHPDRETYVYCVRCGRHACPDCLRSAAVGQQCVECVREGNRGVRRPAGLFGGAASGVPVVTWTLVALNVLAYLAEWVTPATWRNGYEVGVLVAEGQPYRLLTSAFLHEPGLAGFGPLHILFNMWALVFVGPALERMLGRWRFLAVYLLSALGGAALFYLVANPEVAALGASGAIFGLFGSWFVLSRRLRLDSRQVAMLIVLNLVITFTFRGIAWQGHVGGLVCGSLLTAAYVYAPRAQRALVQVAATVALLAVIIAVVVVRDYQLVGSVRW